MTDRKDIGGEAVRRATAEVDAAAREADAQAAGAPVRVRKSPQPKSRPPSRTRK